MKSTNFKNNQFNQENLKDSKIFNFVCHFAAEQFPYLLEYISYYTTLNTLSAINIKNLIQSMELKLDEKHIVRKVTQYIKNFPTNMQQIESAIKFARKVDSSLAVTPFQDILVLMINENTKLIQCQFLGIMQEVLKQIEPQIKNYPQHKSIQYLQSIIYKHLDPYIFANVRISKIRKSMLPPDIQNQTTADKLFTQLITVMSELLQVMREHYGMPRDDKVQGILFQIINIFVSENQSCFLVLQDKKSSEEEKSKVSAKKQQIMVKNTSQSKSTALSTASYLLTSLYTKIKKINPLASKQLDPREAKQAKQLEQKKQMLKQIQKLKKRESLDQLSTKALQKLLSLNQVQIIKTMNPIEKQQFTSILFKYLEQGFVESKNIRSTKMEHIQKQILSLIQQTCDTHQFTNDDDLKEYLQLKQVVLIYKSLQKQYHTDSERRKWFMKFCQDSDVSKMLQNPYSVIKFIESQKLDESKILTALRSLPITQMINQDSKPLPSDKKVIKAHLDLQHEINRIHLYQLQKKYQRQPCLEFQRLTNNKRRVITFLFSGFLSEDTCKVKQWSGLLNNFYDSQVYSIRWESKTVKNMMQFAYKSVVQLGPTQSIAMLGGPYVRAIAIMHNLYQKYQQNPFNPAFEAAIATGQFMAQFISQHFQGYFINLVGFSLGTQLLKNILSRMQKKNSLNMINKVYLIGGCADTNEVQKLIQLSPSSLSVVNLYSNNDYILKYLLRVCRYGVKPIGLNPLRQIQGHKIVNEDCSYFIDGHMGYRDNLQLISKLLKMADD